MDSTLNPSERKGGIAVFIVVIFLSAFLLFQVQPVIARLILPWYGGSSSVWSTCMLFFQAGLVVGYAYAHVLVTALRKRRGIQVGVHLALVALAVVTLPVTPGPELKPAASQAMPVLDILELLVRSVGIPFVILSATGPLLQSWFSELYPKRSPFRLYAVSNIGSLLALLTYPFVFEVRFPVSLQAVIWSSGFIAFALALLAAGVLFARKRPASEPEAAESLFRTEPTHAAKPTARHRLLWVAFSACGSVLLLSITNQLCEDVAVIPFLWVVPLALYLLTFVIAFDHSRWYSRKIAVSASVLTVGFMVVQMNGHYSQSGSWPIPWQIVTLCAALFFTCLVCHGEIVRLKPSARFLTGFYLLIASGGALGGIFVSLVAPWMFNGYWELHVGLVLLAALVTIQLRASLESIRKKKLPRFRTTAAYVAAALWFVALVGMAYGLKRHVSLARAGIIASSRGFYGVLNVREQQIPGSEKFRSLYHGKTIHGLQFTNPRRQVMGTAYYHPHSGVGRAFEFLNQRQRGGEEPLRVGLVGLGIGTLATYARPGDLFRCYEINPQVVDFARSHFTYLEKSEGKIDVVLGDGRISLERELDAGIANRFDLLAVDAFSGHAPPIHLLTREAFELYFAHLKDDGILALHISNSEIDFSDPIRNQARLLGMEALQVVHLPKGGIPSVWALVSRNKAFAQSLERSDLLARWQREEPKKIIWTDDFNSLVQALR